MSRLNFSTRDLERAYHHLVDRCAEGLRRRAGPRVEISLLLLALYAAECGLKWLLLVMRGVHYTRHLAEDDAFFTHDLNGLLDLIGQPPRFRAFTAPEPEQQVHPADLHQLYRYGSRLAPHDERLLIASLLEVFAYIEENAP